MTISSIASAEKAIIDALDLKQKYIKSIEIKLDAGGPPKCTVEFYLEESQVDALSNALKLIKQSYALTKLTDADGTQCSD